MPAPQRFGMGITDPRSPYIARNNRAYSGTGGRPVGATGIVTGGGISAGTTPTGSGISGTQAQSPYGRFLGGLLKPTQASPYQSRFKERAGLLREYTQGAYETAAKGMAEQMGGRGLLAGESGIADTAVGRIREAGAQELSRGYRGIAESEAQREQQMGLQTQQMNLQRLLGGGQLALGGEESALNRLMQYYQTQVGAETAQWQPYWQTASQGYMGGS